MNAMERDLLNFVRDELGGILDKQGWTDELWSDVAGVRGVVADYLDEIDAATPVLTVELTAELIKELRELFGDEGAKTSLQRMFPECFAAGGAL